MKNKVCILTTVHPPFDTRIFHKQAKTLVEAGYDVTLVAQHDKDGVVDGVNIIAPPRPRNRFRRIFGLTWRAFRLALRQGADIYHLHDPELLPWGALLDLITRAKVIYDVHENVRKQILNKLWLLPWIRRPLSLAYLLIENICLSFIDRIIIAEDSYIKNYQGYNNVTAIRNYPILSYLKHHADAVPQAITRATSSLKATYVGGITRSRGVVELIEALRIVRSDGQHVELNLVGPIIPKSFKNELHSLVQDYDFEKNVHMPGTVAHNEVYRILFASHIGIATLYPDPNYVESLPTKLFEYMATGLPVIASNFPLWKEIVEGSGCGICVDPLKPEEIAKAIRYLIEHPRLRKEMGENGRRAVQEKYNWEKESVELLGLYRSLLR